MKEPKYCIHCGTELPEVAQFCCKCGNAQKATGKNSISKENKAIIQENIKGDKEIPTTSPEPIQASSKKDILKQKRAGYCTECKKNVWLKEDGGCQFGHPKTSISDTYRRKERKKEPLPNKETIEIQNIFRRHNWSIGWMFFWRAWLIQVVVNYFASQISYEVNEPLLVYIILLIALVFISNWIGKAVLVKKYGIKIEKFIGWSIFWRGLLLQVPYVLLLIPLIYLTILLVTYTMYSIDILNTIGFLILPIIPLQIFTFGWAINREVFLNAPMEDHHTD